MNYKYPRLLAALLVGLLVASSLFAQSSTTGALEATVSDASGTLPGVTVEVSSPSLQGTRVAVSDGGGRVRFPSLPPGDYTIMATLSGFNSVRQERVTVGLGRTATLEITMSPAGVSQTITVTAEAPIVDVTSGKTGVSVTAETMKSLPVARDFYAVAQVAPGTNEDTFGTTFYGSTSAENQYIIDGLNTTGVEHGVEGKTLNMDFIEEVEVLTGGLPAEYGRITGGIINAITKSGGNEFTGDLFAFQSGGSLRADNSTLDLRPGTTTTVVEIDDQSDYGMDLGGYFLKDRIWFFGAYNYVNQTQNSIRIQPLVIPGEPTFPAGTVFETDIKKDVYAGKLTFRLTDNHSLSVSIFGDPTESDGPQFTIAGPPSTYMGLRKTGGDDYIGRYAGVFGGSFLINANYGKHHENDETTGPGELIPQITYNFDPATGAAIVPAQIRGGFGFWQNQEFDREVIKLDASKFLGNHELKIGGDMEDILATNDSFNGGAGQRIAVLKGRPNRPDLIYYRHRIFIDDTAPGFNRDDSTTWQIANPLSSEPHTENTSVYLQDSWRMGSNFTLNLGVRWEQQQVFNREGGVSIDLNDLYSPRLGFVWDVLNNGRSKLYANYGRFYESIPMDINIRAFGGEISCFCYNTSIDPANYQPDATVRPPGLLGGSFEPVDPDLEGQYIDEVLLGYEYEIGNQMAIGIKGTWRDLGQVIEDMLTTSGEYFIANPSQGIGREAVFYDGVTSAPALKAKREFTAVELSTRKRFSNNYQFFASYVWSRLEGNYDGLFQASTGQLDPNINSGYDYADFSVNNDGLLSSDREHQLKFHGSYTFGGGMLDGLDIGLSTYFESGRPLTASGYSIAYGNWEYYLTERGELGRGPDSYEADVHLGYPIKFGNGMRLNVVADIFNLFDRQSETQIDQRYNRIQDPVCAGIPEGACTDDGGLLAIPGTTNPVARITNPRATAPNPDFLTAGTAFTQPRNIRVGVRFSF